MIMEASMRTTLGNEQLQRRWRPVAWLALVSFMLNPLLAVAQTTIDVSGPLKPGDRIQVTVPGRPELDQQIVVDATGAVTIEPVGSVHLGGLNLAEAGVLLKQKLRLFYPTLDTVYLEAGRSGTVRIYVLGAVAQTGMLNFDAEPSLWDVLRSIGGPLDSANLSEARVIRETDGVPEVHPVNLSGLMIGEDVGEFAMKDGDTLIIPSLQEGIPGVNAADGVKIFGSVGVPTVVPIKTGTPLMDVLMLAGAPTQTANKERIYWVHNDGIRNQAKVVDLSAYLMYGDEEGNPLVYPGDTISVEYTRPSWVRANVPFILGSLAALATIWLAYDRIVNP